MKQNDRWLANKTEVMDFMEANKRLLSKFVDEERDAELAQGLSKINECGYA